MVNDRNTLILYSAAVCNLNCVYCAIDKNPALQAIDKMLEESFQGSYYLDFAKEIFPDPNQLRSIEIWGGETFLGLERIVPTLKQLIEHYPKLTDFFVSSNMTIPEWMDKLILVINTFNEYPDRQFKFRLQMSLDGTQEITDHNRGAKVTERLTNNFKKMVEYCASHDLKNVTLETVFKPTLTIEDIIKYLDTKEKIIDYFKFFEGYLDIYNDAKPPQMRLAPSLPNTAAPSPHTQAEGFIFRDFAKNCYEITQENKRNKIFKYFRDIRPFHTPHSNACTNCTIKGGMCGSGHNVIGLLPNDMISACHSGFTDFLADYKQKAKDNQGVTLDKNIFSNVNAARLIFHKDKLDQYEKQIYKFYYENTTALINNLASQIIMLAVANQIEHKYIREDEAIRAARYIIEFTANCIRDNLAITGSMTLLPLGLLRLLLNGARDYLDDRIYT